MKYYALLIIIAFSITNCKVKKDYKLVADEDGILVELFDSTNIDENRFTSNNTIFKAGTSFFYDFKHFDKNGKPYFFQYIDSLSYWEFIPASIPNKNAIKQVVITTTKGLGSFVKVLPDYNQTVIRFSYPTENGPSKFSSASGVIENEGNIWMHPPRDKYFEILELNPFPYIKAPFKIGTKWTWKLKIGDAWSDGRWKLWSGQIENIYQYEITGKELLKTKLGDLECFVINSKAESRIGETNLVSYFNEEFGFIKMDYTNIDGSKTILELTNKFDYKN